MVQGGMDEGGFARAGNAGDADELTQREIHSEVFEVIFGAAGNGKSR